MDLSFEFSDYLKEKRSKGSKSMTDIARALNINASAVSNWENAISFPSENRLPFVANVYNIDNFGEFKSKFTMSKNARKNDVAFISYIRKGTSINNILKTNSQMFTGGMCGTGSGRHIASGRTLEYYGG